MVGGGGYLVAGLFRVNRSFRTFSHHRTTRIKAQKSLRAAEGLPSSVRRDSIEERDPTDHRGENQGTFKSLGRLARRGGSRRRAAYLVAVLLRVNRLFRGFRPVQIAPDPPQTAF